MSKVISFVAIILCALNLFDCRNLLTTGDVNTGDQDVREAADFAAQQMSGTGYLLNVDEITGAKVEKLSGSVKYVLRLTLSSNVNCGKDVTNRCKKNIMFCTVEVYRDETTGLRVESFGCVPMAVSRGVRRRRPAKVNTIADNSI